MASSKYILTILMLIISVIGHAQLYHATDTIDEDGFISRRDTIKMSRNNVALERNDPYYGTDYIIDDPYRVTNEQFTNTLLDNIYLSAGMGYELLRPRTAGFDDMQLTQFQLAAGKQLSPLHSLRLTLGAAMTYLSNDSYYFFRGTAKIDYLYDISSHIYGYRAARPLTVSLMAGVGANIVRQNTGWDLRFAPDLHGGLQLRIYTGPRCFFNIEPYASISTDQLDHASKANWHKSDVSYGINLNMQYYLDDQLSSQSKLRLLQSRDESTMMVNKKTINTWRTPWFFEAASGTTFSKPEDSNVAIGNATSLAVGRWFSPVLGVRLAAVARSAESRYIKAGSSLSGYDEYYYSHYNSGRIDFLINPFGFCKNFSWDSQYGAYIALGTEFGSAQYHNSDAVRKAYFGQSMTAGIHLWTKLTDDLHLFVEPRFAHNTYTSKTEGTAAKFNDNIPSLSIGLTMLTRSYKFHELDEFDDVQNFMHSYVRGLRVGATGGLTVLQPRDASYGGALGWNAALYLEYRFTHLHSVRASLEYMNAKRNNYEGQALSIARSSSFIASLDYEVSLTNLLSGILIKRWCELEAFAGPSMEYILNTQGISTPTDKGPMFGANAGLKLSKHIWNGISVVAIPTIYAIYGTAPKSMNTVSAAGYHFYQSFSLGVQYKLGSLHRNPAKVRASKLRADKNWSERQQRKLQKYQQRIDRKNARQQQLYDNK